MFIAHLFICAYLEYLMMSYYLPRCPKKDLIWPISVSYLIGPAIFFLLMLVSGVLMVSFFAISTILGFISIIVFLYYFIFCTYKIRKFIFKDQFDRKNWQELGITWEDCKGAIWRSWIFSILISITLSLITMLPLITMLSLIIMPLQKEMGKCAKDDITYATRNIKWSN
jgi:hypothetical protein